MAPNSIDQPTTERRVTVRFDSTQETPCHYATTDQIECRWARVRDISTGGLGLIMDCSLETGKRLIVELPTRNLTPQGISATVIYNIDNGNGTWVMGCAFVKPLAEQELSALR